MVSGTTANPQQLLRSGIPKCWVVEMLSVDGKKWTRHRGIIYPPALHSGTVLLLMALEACCDMCNSTSVLAPTFQEPQLGEGRPWLGVLGT